MIPDPLPAAVAQGHKNLLTQYGQVSLTHLHDVAAAYIDQETGQAQNLMMLALCLKESLMDEASTPIALKADQYTVDG